MVAVGERVFGKYEMLRRLAVGGMGEIFLSRQVGVVDRLVILKSLLPQLASDAQALASFLDEARILASISHPNVVALYEVGEWDNTQFIAMEFINGVDVANLLKFCEDNKKRLPPLVSAQIVREAAMGLDSAHAATDATGLPLRVVHRDISPHNIMVRADGHTKVVDFGVAVAENRQQKTEAGMLKGKLGYMAPEQIKGAPVEPKADQFSLGVLLWEMLTQRRLYTGENAAQIFMRILKETIVAPSTYVQDIPAELDAIVLRMTAQEPVERFARLGDAAMALRRAMEQYKSPDNAVAQLIRATVGPELTQRLKELAVRPAAAGSASGFAAPPPTLSPLQVCGSCGTAAPAGDRFCRACGSSVAGVAASTSTPGSAAPSPPLPTPAVTPAVMAAPRTNTANVVRVGATVPATKTGSGLVNPFLSAPVSRPNVTPPPALPSAELAVVAGYVEVLRNGQVVGADVDARKAAFAVVDDLALRHGTVATKSDNGRFSLAFVGEGATLTAVSLARANVRAAARAGNGVLFRLAVASEHHAPVDQVARLQVLAEQLIDNAAPGSAVIVDAARLKGGDPPTTRSAQVSLREGGSVVAHELQLPRRLIGRSNEIALLDAALDHVERDNKAAQIMLLGEGGVGKSALLEVVLTFARDRGFLSGLARGARVTQALSLDVLRQLVKGVCLDLLARERLTGPWTRAVDLCALPAAYAARLKATIDGDSDSDLQDVPALRRRAVLKAAVLAFFEKLCERAPVLLVVDDQHRSDGPSLEILAELGARLGDRRLAVVVAGRPVQGERALPLARRVLLGPMPPADVVAIAAQLLACPVVDPLASILVQRSLGNPLVVTILLRHLVALRAIASSPSGVQLLVDIDKAGLPSNPTVLIHANHALLPPEAQTLLQAAAHIGQIVEAAQLFRVTDGVRDIVGTLRGLVDVGILEALPSLPGAKEQWVFTSTVEFETIPARLDASQAHALQERVAGMLQKDLDDRFSLETSERLCAHLFAADARLKGADIASRVAERAAALGLFDVAADHYKKALAVEWRLVSTGPGAEERATRVLRTAAAACQSLVEVDANAAVDAVAPVLKSVGPSLAVAARVEALRQRGLALARLKRFSDAESCLDEALETLALAPDVVGVDAGAGVLVDLAGVLEQRGDVDSAINQLQEALPRLLTSPTERGRVYDAVLLLGRLHLRQRNFAPARTAFAQALHEATSTSRASATAEAHALLGAVAQSEGDLDTAINETQQALVQAEGLGDPLLEARLRQQLGRALVALGRRGEAAAVLQRALDCARLGQWDEGVSAAQQLLAVVAG